MLVYVARRLFYGALVVFATAVFAYGGIRALRPDRYPGQGWLDGTWHDTERALVHLDFGTTCITPSCPPIRTLWADGIVIDLGLVFGALIIGAALGTLLGRWCAAHR